MIWWKPKSQLYMLHVLRSRDCVCGRDLRCNGGGRWYWWLYNNGHSLGVQCPVSQQRKRSTELFTPLSPSLTLHPPIITSSAVSAPAPGPACMTACYRDTPKPSSSRSSAADVTNPSHWRLAFVLSIYLHGNLCLKLFLLFTLCFR